MRKLVPFVASACVCALTLVLFSGCATIFKGASSEVFFYSEPAGAEVYVNGFRMGQTPVELKLESKKTYNIEFKKEGYETQTYVISNHVGVGWVVLDVIFGLIPVVVDAVTGSWYELDQSNVNAILKGQQ